MDAGASACKLRASRSNCTGCPPTDCPNDTRAYAQVGIPKDRVTHNTIIRACEKSGEHKLAVDLRAEASASGAFDDDDDDAM